MRMTPLRLYIAVWMLVGAFSTSALAREDAADWRRAGAFIQSRNYTQALEELEGLLAERPHDALLLRLQGICFMELGKADAAVKTLQTALEQDPGSIATRYYLAQALAYQGRIALALQLLREVRDLAPASRYAEQAALVLPRLENLAATARVIQDQKRWNVSARTAMEYDDNVVTRSRHEGDEHADSWRWVLSSYAEFRAVDQAIDNLPFTLGTGYAVYQSFHERETLNDFDLTSQSARIFLSHGGRMFSLPYKAQLLSEYTHTRLGYDPYSHEVELKPDLDIQWLSRAALQLFYSVRWQEFKQDTAFPEFFSRDGFEQRLGARQRFFLFKNRMIWDWSYAFGWSRRQGEQFDEQQTNEVGTAVHFNLPWKLRFTQGVAYGNQDNTEFSPDPRRIDNTITLNTGLSRPLWPKGVSVEATYTHATGESDRDFADYHRNVFGIALSYHY